ncbi:PREDICTED: xanthine dehydrogenase-like [Papilio xuthus]|uniref:Xanthine dehydrogenase-like n=1 Tax=Papilio xuthus TaxID=66420 RepID=A0AAJ7E424_PAPXU|nr:PREDICTED: xanthine dehydrogenase-like [Papilio xuthus]
MDCITFSVNGTFYSVGSEVNTDVTLLDYLRRRLRLIGTKYMCREAGCGACIVTAVRAPDTPPTAVNSCMVLVTSCQGWKITTVEGAGGRLAGYSQVQTTLAQHNGTQCGYCTPGWVMAMHSLLGSRKNLTMLEIEQSFGSNVCRCTGYRSILDAFKRFTVDAPESKRITDIEDLHLCHKSENGCKKTDCEDYEWCIVLKEEVDKSSSIYIKLEDGRDWYRVYTLKEALRIISTKDINSYMLVGGNTAKGAYPIFDYPEVLIDITGITELKGFVLDQNLVLGAGLTLTETLGILKLMSTEKYYFRYLDKLYDHIEMVAHNAVRNIGTIAGNLMIKHKHHEFPSDLFLLFETVGAQLTILTRLEKKTVTMQGFIKEDMSGKIIVNVLLPPLTSDYKLVTFKIMPRSQNVHAIVHAGFLYKLNKSNTVLECRLAFGGISPTFTRAYKTEKFLEGKNLFCNETLQAAIKVLDDELVITRERPELSVEYRRRLAIGLFYKGLLRLCPLDIIGPRYKSGEVTVHDARPVSSGCQVIETDPTLWPLTKPIPKLEALLQCSGEAVYTDDMPPIKNEVFISFALSTVPLGRLDFIDPSRALKESGVIAFYSAKDIPGLNSFTPFGKKLYLANEEIFCGGEVKYYNQAIGMIVAETQQIADRAAKLVIGHYSKIRKPILDVKVAKNDPNRISLYTSIVATDRGLDVYKVIHGSMTIYQQYHFCMETLTSISIPVEEGLEVHAATQHTEVIQVMTSRVLNIDQAKVDVHVRRVGGAYGYKISRAIQGAVAASLAAYLLNRPCRYIQPLTTNTRAVGKRLPCTTEYEVGVNAEGVIQYINCDLYTDNGYVINEPLITIGLSIYNNCYKKTTWNYKFYNAVTDTASNSWFRSPGTLEIVANAEFILEKIAYEMSLDPVQVRLANLDNDNRDAIVEMWETLREKSQYDKRRAAVQKFNAQNRWLKRGLRVSFMRWSSENPQFISANLSIFYEDGSVAITHGGVEIGQGINTKAAQICAYFLKIPLSKIQVKQQITFISPNVGETGGSVTSLNIGLAVQRCCEEILRRLEPIRKILGNPTWEELVKAAFLNNVDLQARGTVTPAESFPYDIYGVIVTEVETDIITGQSEIKRVDLIEDVGQSVSPIIDIGQIEGAFVMGLGYWTCEKMEYEPKTGEVLSDRTWNYWVPQARDIPQDFRVYFREKSRNYEIYLGAKATGEPATSLAVAVPFAMREAIASARQDSGIPTTQWFQIDGPYTTEQICLAAATKFEDFKFY